MTSPPGFVIEQRIDARLQSLQALQSTFTIADLPWLQRINPSVESYEPLLSASVRPRIDCSSAATRSRQLSAI
jgi:hypothetical protein